MTYLGVKIYTNVAVMHAIIAVLGSDYHARYRDGPDQIGMIGRFSVSQHQNVCDTGHG